MKVVLQRVSKANVVSGGLLTGEIDRGLLALLGVQQGDADNSPHEQVHYLARKTANIRIFSDPQGQMNLSLSQVGGDILVVSQFTLFALTAKGNRPSFIEAAQPHEAIPLYEAYVYELRQLLPQCRIPTGIFGADMQIEMVADGPVTIIIDANERGSQ